MNFYRRNKHRNNQAEDDKIDEYPSQSSLNDYSDVYKQELTKCEKELSEITVKFNKMKENNYELEVKVQKLDDELSKERQEFKNLVEKNKKEKQEFDSTLKMLEENYHNHYIKGLEQCIKEQRIKFQQEFKQVYEKYEKNINNIRQKLDEKGNGLRDLEGDNARLKEEASKYQSALGVATNIFLGDGDQNHSVKLKHDILKLQATLESYVTHLKPNMDINIKKVQELAQEYGCLNETTIKNPNKPFIKAVLQRKVLDLVCEFSHEFFKFQCGNSKLESDVESKAIELLKLIKLFSTTRAGTDEVTDASIIKVRQQVYGILGNRGFNNIVDNDGNIRMHDFIAHVSNELNKMMNHHRKINDLKRKEQVEAMAPKLIQDIFKLFWFRINVQEPKLECEFFENDMINPNLMKGVWHDDEIDKLRVDICYFPLIGTKLNSSDAKIYTPAKVFPRYISASDEANEKAYE